MTTSDAADRDRVSALHPPETDRGPEVAGNERLTALAAAILLPLIVAEVATIANIRALMSMHVVVAVLLAGPLTVKPPAPAGCQQISTGAGECPRGATGSNHPVRRAGGAHHEHTAADCQNRCRAVPSCGKDYQC